MATTELTERPPEPTRLPLEYPAHEALRIYATRVAFLFLTLALVALFMLLLYWVIAAIRDRDPIPFLSALIGALFGLLGRPGTIAWLRRQTWIIAGGARLGPPGERAPHRGAS